MITAEKDGTEVFHEAFLSLVANWGQISSQTIPETFRMDTARISTFQSDWQDLTIMACILLLFKQVAGPKSNNLTLLKDMKRNIWVLLNDSDTTVEHVLLYISDHAGKTRGKPLASTEIQSLHSLLDKTLSPDSRIYELMHKRVQTQLLEYLQKKEIQSPETLGKSGLAELSDDILDLAEKVRGLAVHNKAVYAKCYNQILKSYHQLRE
jgi:hypothetical protein